MLGAPLDGVPRHHAGDPDLRVRGLVRARPRIHVAVLVVLALPAERARSRPRLDDEVVRFLEALPVERRLRVVRDALTAGAAHPAGDQPPARDHVDLGQLFGQPQRVFPDREDVTEQDDLGALGDARENRRFDVHHATHAERGRVMLVQHQAVEAHLLGVDLLVEVAVVQIRADPRVVVRVRHPQVFDLATGRADPARLKVLVGTFGEIANKHVPRLSRVSGPPRPATACCRIAAAGASVRAGRARFPYPPAMKAEIAATAASASSNSNRWPRPGSTCSVAFGIAAS